MEVRFNGIKLTRRSFSILTGTVLFACAVHLLAGFPIWLSVLISIAIVLALLLIVVLRRWPKYHAFLDAIGKKIEAEEFHKFEPVVSMVPFQDYSISCYARIEDERLLFGKAKHWRSIKLDEILGVEFTEYLGFKIALLDLKDNHGNDVILCIPWSDSFDQKVEVY